MKIKKGELLYARAFINEHFDRIIDWQIGDIKKCCRMKEDGTCDSNGALVGAFILWVCTIDYFGGLYTGLTTQGATKARFKAFIEKYMSRYDWSKVEELRWSLTHYYSPHFFVLYHENDLEQNKTLHLENTNRGIRLHLGWAIKDLEEAVNNYYEDLKKDDNLKVTVWRYYKKHLPLMPIQAETLIPQRPLNSLPTITAIHSFPSSGTVGPEEWFKK